MGEHLIHDERIKENHVALRRKENCRTVQKTS
jgi:hypothetical protein